MPTTTVSASDWLEPRLLDLVFNGATLQPADAIYVQRFSAAPTDAGGGTPVGSRVAATFAAATGRTAASSADVVFPGATGNTVAVGLYDAPTGGNLLFWGLVDTPVDPAGDDLLIAAGDLSVTLATGASAGISEALAAALLNHVLRSQSYVPASTVDIGLWAGSSEVSGGGYTRKPASWGNATGGTVATDALIEWTNMPAVDVTQVRAYGGSTHLWSWNLTTPKGYAAGSKASIPVDGLTATID